MMEELFDKSDRKGEELAEEMRATDRRLASLEWDTRQPRLVMETDGPAKEKTRKRTKGTVTAVQAMQGDSCSAIRVDPDPMCSISFGDDCTGSPALPCFRDGALEGNGAAVPKSCLSPLGDVLTSSRRGLTPPRQNYHSDTFDQSTLWFCLTEETKFEDFDSIHLVQQQFCFLPSPAGGLLKQNRGKTGCSIQAVLGRLRACPFLGT